MRRAAGQPPLPPQLTGWVQAGRCDGWVGGARAGVAGWETAWSRARCAQKVCGRTQARSAAGDAGNVALEDGHGGGQTEELMPHGVLGSAEGPQSCAPGCRLGCGNPDGRRTRGPGARTDTAAHLAVLPGVFHAGVNDVRTRSMHRVELHKHLSSTNLRAPQGDKEVRR